MHATNNKVVKRRMAWSLCTCEVTLMTLVWSESVQALFLLFLLLRTDVAPQMVFPFILWLSSVWIWGTKHSRTRDDHQQFKIYSHIIQIIFAQAIIELTTVLIICISKITLILFSMTRQLKVIVSTSHCCRYILMDWLLETTMHHCCNAFDNVLRKRRKKSSMCLSGS